MKSHVYFLHHLGEIVYVGHTQSMRSRMISHMKDKVFDRITCFETDIYDGPTIEAFLIVLHKPKYNKRIDGKWMEMKEFEIPIVKRKGEVLKKFTDFKERDLI